MDALDRTSTALLRSFSLAWRAENLSDLTIREYCRHLTRYRIWLDRPFCEAERADIEGYVEHVRVGVSACQAHYAHRALRRFYRWLLSEDEIERDPSAKVRQPRVPEPVTTTADPADLKRLLGTLKPQPGDTPSTKRLRARDRAMVLVLASTGCRLGELARMRLADVDLDADFIVIPRAKSGKPRMVGLNSEAHRALDRYLRNRPDVDGALWVSSTGKPLAYDGIKLTLRRRCVAAGVSISPHQLRRAFAIGWLTQGGSQASLQVLAGWSSPRMVERYVRPAAQELALTEFRRLAQ